MGERRVESSPASDRSRGVICERSPAFRMKAATECDIEARQQARGRQEWQRSMAEGKEDKWEAKEGGNESRIKKERRNIRRDP